VRDIEAISFQLSAISFNEGASTYMTPHMTLLVNMELTCMICLEKLVSEEGTIRYQ